MKRKRAFVGVFQIDCFDELCYQGGIYALLGDYTSFKNWSRFHNRMCNLTSGDAEIREIEKSHFYFGHTLFIWSDGDSLAAAKAFMCICSFHIGLGIKHHLPFLGGIAFGDCIIDPSENTYLGPPIVDAYDTLRAMAMYGAAIHVSLADSGHLDHLRGEGFVTEYPVPLKGAESPVDHEILNWRKFMNDSIGKAIDSLKFYGPFAAEMLMNTRRYFDTSRS